MVYIEQNMYVILNDFVLSENRSASNTMLDNWIEEISLANTYRFDDGIIGMGWLIAFLSQNDYLVLDGDIDEILSDVDDNVYKVALKTVLEDTPDINFLLQLATFFQQRLANKKSQAHFYRRFTHFECLKLVLGKLNSFLLADAAGGSNTHIKVDILLKYSFLLKTCILESVVETAFYATMEELIIYFEYLETGNELDDKIRLALSKLLFCSRQYNNPYWIEKLLNIYESLKAESQATIQQAIWNRLLPNSIPLTLSIEEYRDYWYTKEGQQLLFTLFTNIYEFKVPYDKRIYNHSGSGV